MDSKNRQFEVEFTQQCIEEMTEIYDYIVNKLKENKVARKLMTETTNKILNLSNVPELYMKIGKSDKLKREYHRIVIKIMWYYIRLIMKKEKCLFRIWFMEEKII